MAIAKQRHKKAIQVGQLLAKCCNACEPNRLKYSSISFF